MTEMGCSVAIRNGKLQPTGTLLQLFRVDNHTAKTR